MLRVTCLVFRTRKNPLDIRHGIFNGPTQPAGLKVQSGEPLQTVNRMPKLGIQSLTYSSALNMVYGCYWFEPAFLAGIITH